MQIVAVKQIQLMDLKTAEITQLVHEVDLVKRLSHPNIIEYKGTVTDGLRNNTLSMVVECVFIRLLTRLYSDSLRWYFVKGTLNTGPSSGSSTNLAS